VLRPHYAMLISAAVALSMFCSSSVAAAPADRLLPDNTVGYVSVVDAPTLRTAWEKTPLHALLSEPIMEPFATKLRGQIDDRWASSHHRLGLTVDDLEGLATGELCFAVVPDSSGKATYLLLVDVSGKEEEALEALKKVSEEFIAQGGTKSQQELDGTTITSFKFPQQGDRGTLEAVQFLKGGLLGVSTSIAVLTDVANHLDGTRANALSKVDEYLKVDARCRTGADGVEPHVRWYLKPIPFAEALRAASERQPQHDVLKLVKNQGFGAIRAVGGQLNFGQEPYTFLHRTAVYAPKGWDKAMRMLDFPGGEEFSPLPWIPSDLSTYTTVYWDVRTAFANFGSIFDELFGEGEEGIWEDVLASVAEDPNGPQIDIAKDLVGRLGTRVTLLTDYTNPISPTSERTLFAVESTDPAGMADAVAKSVKDDPLVKRHEFMDFVLWEITDEDEADFGILGDESVEDDSPGDDIPNPVVVVAHGQVMIASHIELLEKVLDAGDGSSPLTADPAYEQVMKELDKLGADSLCARIFSRTDEEMLPTYELFRQGKLPEAQTLFAQLLNTLLSGDTEEGELRTVRIDAADLPEYEEIRGYLGTAGSYVQSEEDGWFITGFTLAAEPVGAKSAGDTPARDSPTAADGPELQTTSKRSSGPKAN